MIIVNPIYQLDIISWIIIDIVFNTTLYSLPSKEQGIKERAFIVHESSLLQLFSSCSSCNSTNVTITLPTIQGTMITIKQVCTECSGVYSWCSQKVEHGFPLGNILLSAAILFAGALPRKTLRVLRFAGIQAISPQTYFRHQRQYLHAAISNVWKRHLSAIHHVLKGEKLVLAGDGRNDSMGHCAKYGTYSLLDINVNQIVYTTTVQVCANNNNYNNNNHIQITNLYSRIVIYSNIS